MGGGAAALGAMRAVAAIKPPFPVTAYVGAVENLVSGRAYKPGDVLTSRKGKTVEINNTDAEGRLVLADALALQVGEDGPRAEERLDAAALVAIAGGAA
jgi:leucyl aminopeptidase